MKNIKLYSILSFLMIESILIIRAQETNNTIHREPPIQVVSVDKELLVNEYGAYPNDNQDDWPGIQKAIKECMQHKKRVKIFFPKGIYHIKGEGHNLQEMTHAFSLSGMSDFIIEGDSAVIMIENPAIGFLNLKKCMNGIIKGITIDYKTLPFSQGKVLEIEAGQGTFIYESDHLGSQPTEEHFEQAKTKWGILFDNQNNRILKKGAPNLIPLKQIEKISNHKFRIKTTSAALDHIQQGDPFAIIARYNGRPTYGMHECHQISFMDNTHYAGPAGSFGIRESSCINIVRCNILQKANRLISQNADCAHITPGYIGPWIEGCIFEGQMDDAINIKTELVYILKTIRDNEYIVRAKLKVGNNLSLFNPREGQLIGTCKVIQAVPEQNHTRIVIDRSFSNLQIGNDKMKDMFFNNSKSNSHFIIKNNTFRNSRRYGMLIQAKNGIIESNTFENVSTAAIVLQNSASWPEGFVPQNIVIKNNRITNCGFDKIYWIETSNPAPILIRTITATKRQAIWQGIEHIKISNNQISSNSEKAIYLSGTQDIIIERNQYKTSGAGSPVYLENSKNIKME